MMTVKDHMMQVKDHMMMVKYHMITVKSQTPSHHVKYSIISKIYFDVTTVTVSVRNCTKIKHWMYGDRT